ncbi:hypothetical protein AB9E05_34775, partial [Rhizobium leguminosarum]
MLWEASGKNLFAVQALVGHKIKSINRYWLHDDEVTLQGSGVITSGTNYRTNVKIFSRLGNIPKTAYGEIATPLSSQGVWTTA